MCLIDRSFTQLFIQSLKAVQYTQILEIILFQNASLKSSLTC